MEKINLSVHKDLSSWHIWDAWIQFQIINGLTVNFSDTSDVLVCDLIQIYILDLDYLNDYFSNYQTVVLFDLLDVQDDFGVDSPQYRNPERLQYIDHEKIIVVTQDSYFSKYCPQNITVLFHNFLLNRSKLYHMYGLDNCKKQQPGYRVWYHENDTDYCKPDIPKEIMFTPSHGNHTPPERKYAYIFSANRICETRTAIYEQCKKLKTYNGITLYKNERLPSEQKDSIPHYKPLPTNLYLDCYINVYAETNVMQNGLFNTAHMTEKTIEPVLRFQMILPFSTTNYYRYLDEIGIQIPKDLIINDWRKIEDDKERLDAYLLNLQLIEQYYTLPDLRDIYYRNLDTVKNNSFKLYSMPFCQSIRNLKELIT